MPFFLALLAVLAQDSDVDRLRKEVERLQAELKAQELRRTPLPPPPAVLPVTPRAVVAPAVKVTAVADEVGLVVLSAGQDDGVAPGDTYMVHRNGNYVAKVVVDRVDRK